MVRALVVAAGVAVALVLGCGGGGPSCGDDQVIAWVIEKSRQHPTHIGDAPLASITHSEELNDAGDWVYCAGVGNMEDGNGRLIQYNFSKEAAGPDDVGFGLRD